MYCLKCGQIIDPKCTFCANCGYQIGITQNQNDDAPNTGFAVLGFFIPIVGLILYLVFESKQPLKAKSAGKGALIGFISGIVVSIIATILMMVGSFAFMDKMVSIYDREYSNSDNIFGDKTEEILEKYLDVNIGKLEKYLDVNIGKFAIEEEKYFEKTKLSVTVKNKGEKKKTFTIEIEAVDKNGARLETDILFAQDLNAGQSMSLDAFTSSWPEKIGKLENATFQVLEISMY